MKSAFQFLLFVLFFSKINYSQQVARVFTQEKINVNDFIPFFQFDESIKSKKEYLFYGSGESLKENVVRTGISPFQNGLSCWNIPITNSMRFDKKLPLIFYLNIFSKNVSALEINIHSTLGLWITKNLKISNDGYSGSLESNISCDEKAASSIHASKDLSNKIDTLLNIDSVSIKLIKKDETISANLVIGECKLFQEREKWKQAKSQFLYEYTHDINYKPDVYDYNDFGTDYPLSQLSSFTNFESSEIRFDIDTSSNQPQQEAYFFDLVKQVFKTYPYYHEHLLDSVKFMNNFTKIRDSNDSFLLKVSRLQLLIRDFHDGHFYLNTPSKKTKFSTTVYAAIIQDDIQVAAVFNDSLKNIIYPGEKILLINNVPIKNYINSTANLEFGDSSERFDLAVSHLFRLSNNDSISVDLIDSNNIVRHVIIKGNIKGEVPDRFRPKDFSYHLTDNGWFYLKINSWNRNTWIKFLNILDSLRNTKGVIFDLRGNPGGTELSALQIASCFIKRKFEFSYSFFGEHPATKPNILLPNQFINLSNLPVRIIVDHKTACASEIFISILKKATNALVVGSKATAGTYAGAYWFVFPKDIVLANDVMQKTCINKTGTSIEYSGIKPDIKVNITTYKDLYGYYDKVLKTAETLK